MKVMQTIIILLVKLVKSLSIEQLKKMFQSLEHFKYSFPTQGQTFYHSSIWLKKYFFFTYCGMQQKRLILFCYCVRKSGFTNYQHSPQNRYQDPLLFRFSDKKWKRYIYLLNRNSCQRQVDISQLWHYS